MSATKKVGQKFDDISPYCHTKQEYQFQHLLTTGPEESKHISPRSKKSSFSGDNTPPVLAPTLHDYHQLSGKQS